MPQLRSTLEEMGLNAFNRRESYSVDPTVETPVSAVNQILPEGGIGLEKTSIDTLTVNQSISSANFITAVSGWVINGDGNAEFNNVTVRGTIYATLGEIGGFTIGSDSLKDTADSFGLASTVTAGNDVRIWAGETFSNRDTAPFRVYEDGTIVASGLSVGKLDIPDTVTDDSFHVDVTGNAWWGANVADFVANNDNAKARIMKTGSAYFENIEAKGVMKGTTFQYDVVSAIAGQLMVSNADTLDVAMTALDASTLTTKGSTTFAVNDMLLIQADNGSGVEIEHLRITNIASAPTYTVTRDLAASYAADTNPAWAAGTTITKQGSSDGAAAYSGGWLRLFGEGTNSPYYSVFARTGVDYDDYDEAVRLGNLKGIAGLATDVFGLFMGDYSADKYFLYNGTTGAITVRRGKVNDLFDGNITMAYDFRGRIATITDNDDGVVYTPTYSKGRLDTLSNGTFTWTFIYGGGRITSITQA